jgi:hypothetical protein
MVLIEKKITSYEAERTVEKIRKRRDNSDGIFRGTD